MVIRVTSLILDRPPHHLGLLDVLRDKSSVPRGKPYISRELSGLSYHKNESIHTHERDANHTGLSGLLELSGLSGLLVDILH